LRDNDSEFKNNVIKCVNGFAIGKSKRMNWVFDDALLFLSSEKNTIRKNILQEFISFLNGEKDRNECVEKITGSIAY